MSHSYTVELRFQDKDLIPSEISGMLMLQPSIIREFPVNRRDGVLMPPLWGFNGRGWPGFKPEWENFEDGLRFLTTGLENRKNKIKELSKKFNGIWWCGHFQSSFDGGPELSPGILSVLASYETKIYIDNYFDEG